ncbi:histone acetyltransferase HPA2 and related acetyltransferases [Vibrio maritimus]|uniref:Histone acetyltransferase HPA2 and related acetyltransferases n=1 Tax=Vibrio maritimus TaxID=990268 RepID=A0A090SYX1_9VIBR|nr:histone acetyltransferase HPA2 and related acetyltransferases [Vibrio maritimus]
MKLNLRKAQLSDLDYLVELRDITMRDYLIEVGGNTTREAYERNIMWKFEEAAQIIQVDGEDAGFWRVVFEEDKNRYYLDLIQVHPKFKGKSVGGTLIRDLINQAHKEGKGLALSVWKINVAARRLYEKLGFEVYGEDGDEWLLEYKNAALN